MEDKDKIIVHRVELGFNVEEEIAKALEKDLNPETKEGIDHIINELAKTPANQKAMQKVNEEKSLENAVVFLKENKEMNKTKFMEIMGVSTAVGIYNKLKAYGEKNHKINILKEGDIYKLG